VGDARSGTGAIDHDGVHSTLVEAIELVVFDVESLHDAYRSFPQGGEQSVAEWPMKLHDIEIKGSRMVNDVVVTVLSKHPTAKE
jgi:hypothetical protein